MKKEFEYRWHLKDAVFKKDKGKVFSCFACGGGSTMGYKLAGFNVVGMNEIDPKIANIYIINHKPKHSFIMPIQEMVLQKNLPKELFNLDILDGSPPCSSFSMSGTREKDWGKERKFKEGQAVQILDTLFFDLIALAKRLRPKVVISENVKGILAGNAREYVRKILQDFDNAGYQIKEFVLDSSQMEVPQKRERVFFIAVRKDLAKLLPQAFGLLFENFPKLNMKWGRAPILFDEIRTNGLNNASWTEHDQYIWDHRIYGDSKYADTLVRIENRNSNFNSKYIYSDKLVCTLASSEGSKMTLFDEPRRMNSIEMTLAQSFPLDYDFGSDSCSKIKYLLGMSVPPLMTAHLAKRIYEEWQILF